MIMEKKKTTRKKKVSKVEATPVIEKPVEVKKKEVSFPMPFAKGVLEKRDDNKFVYVKDGEDKRVFNSLEEAKWTFKL